MIDTGYGCAGHVCCERLEPGHDHPALPGDCWFCSAVKVGVKFDRPAVGTEPEAES